MKLLGGHGWRLILDCVRFGEIAAHVGLIYITMYGRRERMGAGTARTSRQIHKTRTGVRLRETSGNMLRQAQTIPGEMSYIRGSYRTALLLHNVPLWCPCTSIPTGIAGRNPQGFSLRKLYLGYVVAILHPQRLSSLKYVRSSAEYVRREISARTDRAHGIA